MGIGVGIPAVALIIGASIAAFYFGKRRARRKDTTAAQNVTSGNTGEKVEYTQNMPPQYNGPQEYNVPQQYNGPNYNMPQQYAWPAHAEMPTNANVPEMQGSGQHNGMPGCEASAHRY